MLKGKWTGLTWVWCEGGSFITGKADFFGNITGDDVAYIYPDLKCAIFGTFTKSQLNFGQFCYVSTVRFIKGHLPEMTFSKPQGPTYGFEPGDHEYMCKNPLFPDGYENIHVFVKQSKMKGGGEGLFAKVDLAKGRIVSFYNGIKETETEIEDEKDDWEANAYKIMDMLGKNPETGLCGVIDIPDEFISTKNYV